MNKFLSPTQLKQINKEELGILRAKFIKTEFKSTYEKHLVKQKQIKANNSDNVQICAAI